MSIRSDLKQATAAYGKSVIAIVTLDIIAAWTFLAVMFIRGL